MTAAELSLEPEVWERKEFGFGSRLHIYHSYNFRAIRAAHSTDLGSYTKKYIGLFEEDVVRLHGNPEIHIHRRLVGMDADAR